MTVNLICIVAPPTKQCMHVDLLISYKHALTACVCVHRSDHIIHDHMCRKDKQCQNMLSKVITSYYWYGNLVWYSCPAWIERTFSNTCKSRTPSSLWCGQLVHGREGTYLPGTLR